MRVTEQPTQAWGHGLATLDARGHRPRRVVPRARAGCGTRRRCRRAGRARRARGPRRRPRRDPEVRLVEIADLQAPPASHRGRLAAPAPALRPARAAARDLNWTASSACSPTSCGPAPGPCAVDGFEATRARLRARRAARARSSASTSSRGWSTTSLPTGVRIADADRVRLGAHLAEGTTVMHEGFVNYNAGTLGASMVEGRISAGVVVGDGSDVGGGASIMGTLSGGGKRGHLDRRALPARRQRRHRHLARRRLRRRGRLLRHRRHQGHPRHRTASRRWSRRVELSGRRQRAVPPQLGDRRHRGRAVEARAASRSTPRCTPTDGRRVSRAHRPRPLVAARGAGRSWRSSACGGRCTARRAAGRTPRAAPPTVGGHTVELTTEQAEQRRA